MICSGLPSSMKVESPSAKVCEGFWAKALNEAQIVRQKKRNFFIRQYYVETHNCASLQRYVKTTPTAPYRQCQGRQDSLFQSLSSFWAVQRVLVWMIPPMVISIPPISL